MSVYKAVSNYFIDILDYLTVQSKQYNDNLETYFSNMPNYMKIELMAKLSDCLLRTNQLFKSRVEYYTSKIKEQNALRSIFIVIMVLIGIIFYGILFYRIKKEVTFDSGNKTYKYIKYAQSFITYTIVYMVILTVFLMMVINANNMKKLYVTERDKAHLEGKKYFNYIFSNADTARVLFSMAVMDRGYEDFEDQNFINVCDPNGSLQQYKDIFNCDTTKHPDYLKAFNNSSLNSNIRSSLITFYGKGYSEVRKIYVLSGPIPMLKETRRILNSYYNISTKERQGKENMPANEKQVREMLKTNVIKPLLLALDITTSEKDPNALQISLANNEFKESYDHLKKLFVYTSAYMLQIYSQNSSVSIDPAVLPANIGGDEFKNHVKAFFQTHASTKLPDYMSAHTDHQKIYDNMEHALADMIPLFKETYTVLNSKVQRGNYIIYDKTTIINTIMSELNSIQGFNDAYKHYIKSSMYDHIVLPIKFEYDADVVKIQKAIDDVSNSITAYRIDVVKYNDFILSEITKNIPSGEILTKTDIITDVISQIIRTVKMKKQLQGKEDQNKFLEPADFIDVMNHLTLNELNEKLETEYLTDVVNRFYNDINSAVVRKEASLNNLFYGQANSLDLAEKAVKLTTSIIILVLINYAISTSMLGPFLYTDLQKKIAENENVLKVLRQAIAEAKGDDEVVEKKNHMLKEVKYELDLLYREKRNRTINFYVRLLIPIFVVTFIISLMFASFKKAQAKSDFNHEMIENNTYHLKSLVQNLQDKMTVISSIGNNFKKISDIQEISDQQKTDIFNTIKGILERFEKCNFILEAEKSQLPFPYSEIAMSGFMIVVTVLCMLYVYSQLNPSKRLAQIKELNKMKAEAAIADKAAIRAMKKELEYLTQCHEDDLDTIVFTLKVVFFVFIITFLIFYSSKVVSSSGEYRSGLYNSGYFDTDNCVT